MAAAGASVFPRFGRPRVLIGAGDSPRRALDLYHPSAWTGRLARVCARLPGAALVLLRRAAGDERPPAAADAVIRARLDAPEAVISYYVGNDDARRRAVAQVATDAGVIAYVKLGRGAAVAAGIANEARTLARLAARDDLPAAVPRLLGTEDRDDWRYLFLAPPEEPTRPRARPTPPTLADLDFIAALFATEAGDMPIAAWGARLAIDDCLAALDDRDGARIAARAARRGWDMACDLFAESGARVGQGHGDYTPWNVFRRAEGALFVFDWEHADTAAPALGDLLHFLIMPRVLVARRSLVAVIGDLLDPDGPDAAMLRRHAEALGVADAAIGGYLLLYLLGRFVRQAGEGGDAGARFRPSAGLDRLATAIDATVARLGRPAAGRRVLLSAYACEPGKGSEPAVGWNWAIERARRGDETWVVTRANNRAAIDAALGIRPEAGDIRFLFYDPPAWARRWKAGRRGIRTYYLAWQWGAAARARVLHRVVGFELVHHVTFVGVRQPSFMGRLGIPFVFGPVGGGERAPWRLRRGFGPRGQALDAARDLANALVRVDPMMGATFAAARRIYVTSEQTRALLPRRHRAKARLRLAIGFEGATAPRSTVRPPDGGFSVLFAGRLVYWKGLALMLWAFRRLADARPEARLTVIGDGPDGARARALARRLGLDNRVEWRPSMPRADLLTAYAAHDVFLYPSLHDSGGMVVLEALAAVLPAVCLDLGGPGQIVDDDCGRVVATTGRGVGAVAGDLAAALIAIAGDAALRARLAAGARARATALSWPRLVADIADDIAAG